MFTLLLSIYACFTLDASLRRRLVTQERIDARVNELISGEGDELVDLALWYDGLALGPNAEERCHEAGLAFCEKLGDALDDHTITCESKDDNPDFSYIGPATLESESDEYFCAEYINDVDPKDKDTITSLVTLVEQDPHVHISSNAPDAKLASCVNSNTDMWNLQSLGDNEEYYYYDENDGKGVIVYVIDDGVNPDHPDFEGRVIGGWDMAGEGTWKGIKGHGTHVAGTIASKTFGVARGASIFSVNVFRDHWFFGFGASPKHIEQGLQKVAEKVKKNGEKAVINMSLGMSRLDTGLDKATKAVIAAGITVVVAAGNDERDACEIWPGSVQETITVGAVNRDWETGNYEFAYFSNHGRCVDILAPGQEIASPVSSEEEKNYAGTSMASPHVAGVVAQIISRLGITDPALIKRQLLHHDYGKSIAISKVPEGTTTRFLKSTCRAVNPTPSCGQDTWAPEWGKTPMEACNKWWASEGWGANFDCGKCKSTFAQANCKATCCKKCPANLPTCKKPNQDFSIRCENWFQWLFSMTPDCGEGCEQFQSSDSNCVNQCCKKQKSYCKDDFECMHDRNCGAFVKTQFYEDRGADTYNPGWGSSPQQRCGKWWNKRWGADKKCNKCEADWAQSNCHGTCFYKCPHLRDSESESLVADTLSAAEFERLSAAALTSDLMSTSATKTNVTGAMGFFAVVGLVSLVYHAVRCGTKNKGFTQIAEPEL